MLDEKKAFWAAKCEEVEALVQEEEKKKQTKNSTISQNDRWKRGERERQEDVIPLFHKQKCDTRFSPCLFVQILLCEGASSPLWKFRGRALRGTFVPTCSFPAQKTKKITCGQNTKLR